MSSDSQAHRSLDALRRDLRERAFRLSGPPLEDRVGLELEFLLRDRETEGPVSLDGPAGALSVVAELADRLKWKEGGSGGVVPRWWAKCGCAVSFEPGGQLEIASPPGRRLADVHTCMEEVLTPLRSHMARHDWRLLPHGIDPLNAAGDVELELNTQRYRRMASHFATIGPSGRRMMRQTASIHINIDLGEEPIRRWRVANALTPVLTAVFANSSVYEGRWSGFRNFRAWQWRTVDPVRTGVVGVRADPVEAYLAFALDAPAILAGPEGQRVLPFREWWDREGDLELWRTHLTTLFPEVRPRGYLEVRSVDLQPDRWLLVPVAFVLGVLYSAAALGRAEALLPVPSDADLVSAAREGLTNPQLRDLARALWEVALDGMRDLPDMISASTVALADEFRERFTARGLDPGADLEGRLQREDTASQPA